MKNKTHQESYDEGYEFRKEQDKYDLTYGFIFGLIIGILFTVMFMSLAIQEGFLTGEDELGQAICEEEYQMDFDKYDSEGLHCEPMLEDTQRTYDGITVNVGVD